MLVDDDADFLAQQKLRFERAGYEAVTVEGPDQARAALMQNRPDLVVVDLMMGDMDAGIVLAHEFKRARPDLPIILVTGVTRETGLVFDADTAEARRWLWVDKVMAKPVRFAQLQAEVERLLARPPAAGGKT
jgi:DNA-binding response OmpR family regulator